MSPCEERLCLFSRSLSFALTSDDRNLRFQGHKNPRASGQQRDKQPHHPGTFCGQPNKSKSLQARDRIHVARRWHTAIITPLRYPRCSSEKSHMRTLLSTLTYLTQLHTQHGRRCFGSAAEIAAILMPQPPPSPPPIFIYR